MPEKKFLMVVTYACDYIIVHIFAGDTLRLDSQIMQNRLGVAVFDRYDLSVYYFPLWVSLQQSTK